jgi:hypothetical protein
MRCKEFQIEASGYVDGQLGPGETVRYHAHLSTCADCRAYVDQLDRLGDLLRTVGAVDLPRELHGNVMLAVRSRARGEAGVKQRLVELVQRFNPQMVSYSAGAVVSGLLFALTLAGFRGIPVSGPIAHPYIPGAPGSIEQLNVSNKVQPGEGARVENQSYELPRVADNGSLVSFSNVAYRKRGDEGAAALVEVMPDGSGKIVEILEEPNDPRVMESLRWSFSKTKAFQPAIVSGRAVPTRIVFLIQKMDVIG